MSSLILKDFSKLKQTTLMKRERNASIYDNDDNLFRKYN